MTALVSYYPGDGMMALALIALLGITLVSAAALLMVRPLNHHPAVRHVVLLSALICLLLIPTLTFALDRAGLAIVSIPWPTQEPIVTADTPAPDDSTDEGAAPLPVPETRGGSSEIGSLPVPATREAVHEPADVTAEQSVHRPPPEPAIPSTVLRSTATLISGTWLVGTVLLSLGILRSWWALKRIRQGLRTIGEESYHGTLSEVRRHFEIDRWPEIGISSDVSTPIVAGLLRPVVILPAEQVDVIGREQLRDVLVHEVAHVIRRDNWIVLLQAVAKAVFWPHLLIHRLSRCLTQAREEVCDNHVLVHTGAVEYGETLLRLAELARNHKLVPASVGILHWHGKLEQRISNLLDKRRNKMTRTNALVVVAVVTAFALTSAAICGTTIASANGKRARDADAKEAAGKEAGTEKKRWGDLVVRFVYDGDAPVPAKIKVTKDQGVYGDTLADQSLKVGNEGGLANVVVYFLNGEMPIHPEAKKVAERPALLKALGGHFQPRLLPLQVGQQLTMQNQDPVPVSFHLHPRRNRASNHLARPDTEHSYRFQQAEKLPIPITCDIHPWMRAYLLPLEHTYAAVSDKDGKVRIRNLPSGDWTFRIWHEKAGYLVSPEAKNRRYRLQVRTGVNDLGVVKVSPTLALGPIKGLKNKAEAEKKPTANDGRRTQRLKPIRGSVADSSGKPIVGARVYLRRRPMGVSSSSMEPYETPNLAATKTDAEGRFVFQDVQSPLGAWDEAPFPLDVIALSPGKAVTWQPMSGYEPVRLILAPEAVLHGRVVDDLGNPSKTSRCAWPESSRWRSWSRSTFPNTALFARTIPNPWIWSGHKRASR